MTEERIENENEKSREKYFYVSKECTYKFLGTVVASFIGALLALAVFTALHKPPVPPAGPQMRPDIPCPCRIMDRGGRPDRVFPPRGEFRHHKHFRGGEFQRGYGFRGHKGFRGCPKGKLMPPPPQKFEAGKNIQVPQNLPPNKK
ncbi:hypothetical protein IKP85_01100 [bacterium]|nr:hypothetical protein [bacterium]